MKIVYTGTHNTLKVVAEKIPCKSLWLRCDNGEIEKGDVCLFYFVPIEARPTTLYVCKIVGRDTITIDSVWLRVRAYSEPMAAVLGSPRPFDDGNKRVIVSGTERQYLSGPISVDSIHKLTRIITHIEGFDYDVEGQFPITHFTTTIISDDNCKRRSSTTPIFSSDLKSVLSKVKAGETVLFTDVTAIHDGKAQRLRPLELNVR